MAIRLIRFISRLVPPERRAEWLREWEGEFAHFVVRGISKQIRIVARATGALEDALWIRKRERRRNSNARRTLMTDILQDLQFTLRTLRRNLGFSTVAIFTLALGIAANTAVFSVVNGVLLKPLPYDQPEQLSLIWTNFGPDLPQNWISGPEFVEIREHNSAFQDVAVVIPFTVSVTGDGPPEQVPVAGASANFFDVMRTEPAAGRLFRAQDEGGDAAPIAVLSYGYWQRRYGGDASVIGQAIIANGAPFEVVGVLPPEFQVLHPDAQFPKDIEFWTALEPIYAAFVGVSTYAEFPRGAHGMRGFARLRPGISLAQAQADLDRVANTMLELSPNFYDFEGWGLTAISLHDDLVEGVRPALLILLGAVGFVLLIATVNVANLMLHRAAAREREIAVRTAVGAGRSRLIRQLLTESLTLSGVAGVLGLVVAQGLVRMLDFIQPADLPRADHISIDGGVLLFTLAISMGTGIVFGLAPIAYALKESLTESLKEGGRGVSGGVRGRRTRSALVVAEVALALVLLVGAGLMLRSFAAMLETDPGYQTENLLTLNVSLPSTQYGTPAAINTFFDDLLDRVNSLPGVTSAGLISQLPLSGQSSSGTTGVQNSETTPEDQRFTEVDRRVVTPEYFTTMGIRLLRGRTFTTADNADGTLVAIVDEEFVKRFWPSEDPIGQYITIDRQTWREVVGVVAHSRHTDVRTVGREQAYFPLTQFQSTNMYLAVRTQTDPISLATAVRQEVWAIDPDQPVSDVAAMSERLSGAVSQPRFNLVLLGGFAGVALLLAAVGIYGVVTYSVTQRRHEIGVRMALGADSQSVRGLVLRQGLTLVVAGLVAGLGGALVATRLIQSILFEVPASDPLTYVAVAGVLAGVAALACLIPAVKATRVSPISVLQTD